MDTIKRSPFFYVGDKSDLLTELMEYFPRKINRFIEPFTGGGSVFLNLKAEEYLLNDIDKNIVNLHKFLIKYSNNKSEFFDNTLKIIKEYNLSRSYCENIISLDLKKKWKKTYYAHFNKTAYNKLKRDYNYSKNKSQFKLYLLLIYGFNRMLRFNSKGEFNLPVGNVDFNNNVVKALNCYFDFVKDKKIYWSNLDFREFMDQLSYKKDDFVYFDPPYLISFSEYNKLWNENTEKELLSLIDQLDNKGVKFAISNIISYKGRENKIFKEWMRRYKVFKIQSNYISYHDNTKKEIAEVLVTNYDKEKAGVQTIAFYYHDEESRANEEFSYHS
jgi:DNA adenine methylase